MGSLEKDQRLIESYMDSMDSFLLQPGEVSTAGSLPVILSRSLFRSLSRSLPRSLSRSLPSALRAALRQTRPKPPHPHPPLADPGIPPPAPVPPRTSPPIRFPASDCGGFSGSTGTGRRIHWRRRRRTARCAPHAPPEARETAAARSDEGSRATCGSSTRCKRGRQAVGQPEVPTPVGQ